MQPRGRRRDTALGAAVNRLITAAVAAEVAYVRRQGNLPQLVQALPDRLRKTHAADAAAGHFDDLRLNATAVRAAAPIQAKRDAGLETAPAHKATPLPAIVVQLAEKEDLHRVAGRLMRAQPGRDHPTVVGNEQVARPQIRADIAEQTVFDAARRPIQHKQAAAVARLGRPLGDELFGEVVVEKVCLHGQRSYCVLRRAKCEK